MEVKILEEDIHFIKNNGEHLLITTKPDRYGGTKHFINDKKKLEKYFEIAEMILELENK